MKEKRFYNISEDKSQTGQTLTKDIQRPTSEKLDRLKNKLHQMLLQGVKGRNNHVTSSSSDNQSVMLFGQSNKVCRMALTDWEVCVWGGGGCSV